MGSFMSFMFSIFCECSCCIDADDNKSQTNSQDQLLESNNIDNKNESPYSSLTLDKNTQIEENQQPSEGRYRFFVEDDEIEDDEIEEDEIEEDNNYDFGIGNGVNIDSPNKNGIENSNLEIPHYTTPVSDISEDEEKKEIIREIIR